MAAIRTQCAPSVLGRGRKELALSTSGPAFKDDAKRPLPRISIVHIMDHKECFAAFGRTTWSYLAALTHGRNSRLALREGDLGHPHVQLKASFQVGPTGPTCA